MIRLKRSYWHLLLCATLIACGGSNRLEPREVPTARVQAFWPSTNLRQTYTVRSDDEWKLVWLAHEPTTLPRSERPQVDFSRKMILGLTQGFGPNGCHGLSIRRVVEEEDELRVEYLLVGPQPFVACTQAFVALTDFVIVDRSDKRIAFVQIGA